MVAVVALLGLRVIFDEKFDNFDDYATAREQAEDKDKFDRDFEAMAEWLEQYKKDNPGATDAEAGAAFEAMFE